MSGIIEDFLWMWRKLRNLCIGTIVIWVPACLLGYALYWVVQEVSTFTGIEVSSYIPFCGGVLAWLAFYITWGFTIIPQQGFIVVERLGQYHRVMKTGVHFLCLPGLIDKKAAEEHYRFRREQLYNNLPNEEIEFKGGASAGILGECFLRVIPGKEYEFAYSQQNPIERAKTLLDEEVRHFFQQRTLEEALVERYALWENIKKSAEDDDTEKNPEDNELNTLISELKDSGVELDNKRGVIVSDIILPPELIRLRELEIEGQKETLKNKALVSGFVALVNGVAEGAKISTEAAAEFINTQKFLETLPHVPANVVIVGGQGGVQGLMTSVVGATH